MCLQRIYEQRPIYDALEKAPVASLPPDAGVHHWHCAFSLSLAVTMLSYISRACADEYIEARPTPSAEQVLGIWNGVDVQSLRVQATVRHWMLRHKEASSAPRRSDVIELLKDDLLPLVGHADSANLMSRQTDAFLVRGAWKGTWANLSLIQDADGVRNELHPTDSSGKTRPGSLEIHIKANGEDLDYFDSSLRQASVRPLPSRLAVYKLSDLCFVPRLSVKAPLLEMVITKLEGSICRITTQTVGYDPFLADVYAAFRVISGDIRRWAGNVVIWGGVRVFS